MPEEWLLEVRKQAVLKTQLLVAIQENTRGRNETQPSLTEHLGSTLSESSSETPI